MAGFTTLAIGLALGMIGSKAASKLKKAPKPGATDLGLTPDVGERPEPIDAQRRASDATGAAQRAGVRQRKRVASGGTIPRMRAAIGRPTASAQVEPRSLIGY